MNNFHTHVERCGHATGTEREYIEEALRCGFDELGFSDHGPEPSDTMGYRMDWAELDDYIDTVTALKKEYSGRIKIYTGFEYEYSKGMERSFLRDVREKPEVDYFALGLHYFKNGDGDVISSFGVRDEHDFKYYYKLFEQACESEMYSFFAHPDVVFRHLTERSAHADAAMDAIVRCAVEYDMPLEINANGMRRPMVVMRDGSERFDYPYRRFWDKAAEAGARVIIGSDCHSVENLYDTYMRQAYALAKAWDIDVVPLSGDELE